MERLRRFLSMLLLLWFAVPAVLPLLVQAQGADSNLPACCRRNGRHHCAMSMGTSTPDSTASPRFAPPVERCPCVLHAEATPHTKLLSPGTRAAVYAGLFAHPTGFAQTESKRRLARDRSRQQRGPPQQTQS